MAATVGWRPRCCLSHGELRPCRRVHCSRDPACLLLRCKLLWLCNFEDSRTFSMKTKIVIFFLWCFFLIFDISSGFFFWISPFITGCLFLFHKGTSCREKKENFESFQFGPTNCSASSRMCERRLCAVWGAEIFWREQIFLGSLGEDVLVGA